MAAFRESDHSSLALLAKTQKQAARLHAALAVKVIDARLLDDGSTGFSNGIIVCFRHLARGWSLTVW
ncbi:hypothetical protein [Tabrizicola caldifontis]|uniref:hypothetical protein n=1 Tax=Tabrizicola caldifontis TaxID=2528036 RepID=UPI001081FAC3|nr:hypothetical protein [Rhodobacter sp. YIM 73028]